MRWKKLGLVWSPQGGQDWARSHAMVPTPLALNDKVLRLFTNCLDASGRARPTWVDLDAADPLKVLGSSAGPLLDLGKPGCFDDNGVIATTVVMRDPGTLFMYYAGFELCTQVPYRIMTGLAVSRDGGSSFERYSQAPVLDRSDGELFVRSGPFVLKDNGRYRLWYVAGNEWTQASGKNVPVHRLRYQESEDGIHWKPQGLPSVPLEEDEHGFGRSYVVKRGPQDYQLFFGIRRLSLGAYRLGYAESKDGITWTRRDDAMGLDVSSDGFDSHSIGYPAVIQSGGRTWCFYNGDNYGQGGFGVAVLEQA
jgi:hypothetical protein